MKTQEKQTLVDRRLLQNSGFKREQAKVFLITVTLYCAWHAARTVWAYSKKSVKETDPYFTDGKMGVLDMSFMLAYAFGLFINGWIGDQSQLKNFIAIGSVISLTGYLTFATLARNEMYNIVIFALCFIMHGFGQSRGFPGNIAILGNWVEAEKRGFLLGLWNASVNIGNIMGQQIGRLVVDVYHVHWSNGIFMTGALMIIMSIVMHFFLHENPKKAGITLPEPEHISTNGATETGRNQSAQVVVQEQFELDEKKGIGFWEAWNTPGLVKYSIVFACIKGSTYGLLFWLPDYLQSIMNYGGKTALVTAMYEIGQFIGAISLGYISDLVGKRAAVIVGALYISAFTFIILASFAPGTALFTFAIILFLAGIFFGGPEVVVGGVISSDLGEDTSVKSESRSMSTMAGIVDGSGSIGAALIQLIIPFFKTSSFFIYFGLCLTAAIILTPTLIKEFKQRRMEKKMTDIELKTKDDLSAPLNGSNDYL